MRLIKMFFAVALVSFMLLSCNKEVKIDVPTGISEHAVRAFVNKYGNSTDVKWVKKGDFYVAIFHTASIIKSTQGALTSSWYSIGGWELQFTQELPFAKLPESVKNGFKEAQTQFNYTDWKVDEDADFVARFGMDYIYVIEIEKDELKRELSFSREGVLLKDVEDKDDDKDEINFIDPKFLTEELRQALLKIFQDVQNVVIQEIDVDDNKIEVDVKDGIFNKEITFDKQYTWISTEHKETFNTAKLVIKRVSETLFTKLLEFGKANGIDFNDTNVQNKAIVEITQFATNEYTLEIEYKDSGKKIEIDISKDGNITLKK